MSQLNGRYCAICLDELRYAIQWRNVRVRPDAQIAVGDAALGYDGCGFREDQCGAAGCHLAKMDKMPVIGKAVARAVLAHWGNDDAIFKRDPAQRDRREQKRLRCHWIPFY